MMDKKFPRIPHLPWSKGKGVVDIVIDPRASFWRENVIVTEKMDGENTTITRDNVYARSLDTKDHPSRHWIKKLAANFQYLLDQDMRICGENLYAVHSIEYSDLNSYFYVFGMFKGNHYMSWYMVKKYADVLGLYTVPVLFEGVWTNTMSEGDMLDLDLTKKEGYVIRRACSFQEEDFSKNIAKFVRENHVQTDDHWMHQSVRINGLRKNK